MAEPFYFICYSRRDGGDIVLTLADQLAAGPPSIPVWIDRRNLQPSIDWDEQIVAALRGCAGILYVMTKDSVSPNSQCKREWTWGLKYKKPIIPLLFHKEAEMPFRLVPRQHVDFTYGFIAGLARLREHVRWRSKPEGVLHTLKERLEDAHRDLAYASQTDMPRIEEEITQLEQQIAALQDTIDNPQAAQERTQQNIERGLERERQPAVPVAAKARTRFINRPPMVPPLYFQDRHLETGLIGNFLRNDGPRLMTVVGRGGVGKTAMVCRLLRSLEGGKLPDDGGELPLDGIVYLSSRSGHPVNFPNLFHDLCKLVPEAAAKSLDQLYKDPMQSVNAQMQALVSEFPEGRTIVLLDNFEDVVDVETQTIKEKELDEALRAMLEAPPHGLKLLLTTRVAPRELLRVQPGLQGSLELDQGLKSPYAENVLKAMDTSGKLGLSAPDAPLAEAREATRGFPRALEAVVGILRTDRSTDLRSLLKELRQLGSRAEDVVRDLVGEAFNRLDPLAQEVMQALAVYGAPVPSVAVDYLLQPYRIGIDSSKTLGRLVNMQFVRGEAGRYYLHQVDRDYALGQLVEGGQGDREAEPPPWTRYALRHRAAEYFKESRKPRESWKTLEDLAPQLAEFDLRVAGGDYNAAVSVLIEIDADYLDLWGHHRLLMDRYERLQGMLTDPYLEFTSGYGLGSAYIRTGQFEKGLRCSEHCLALAGEQENKRWEASALLSIAWVYGDLGEYAKAIDCLKQALSIYEELRDEPGEAVTRGNLANCLSNLGLSGEAIEQYEKAIALHREVGNREGMCRDTYNLANEYAELGNWGEVSRLAGDARQQARAFGYKLIESGALSLFGDLFRREGRFQDSITAYEEACAIGDETNAVQVQMLARSELAWVCLAAGDIVRARSLCEDAGKYRYPRRYASTLALLGVVALRQGDAEAASKAFATGLSEAEIQLAGATRAYSPAYAKALSLAGFALCRDATLATAAAEAYREARAISAAPGVIMDELRKLDILAIADSDGFLQPVRAAAAGEA